MSRYSFYLTGFALAPLSSIPVAGSNREAVMLLFFGAILYYKRACIYVGWGKGDLIMVIHPIEPIYDKSSKILILGSFPSVKSREARYTGQRMPRSSTR